MSESIKYLVPALIKAKATFKPAVKDAVNPHFRSKFVSLGGVHDAIDDALTKNGIAVMQPTRIGDDGKTVLVTMLVHSTGEWISGDYPITAAQPGPQGEGSALTYARRYALMAMVGIAPEDDDGEAATPRQETHSEPQRAARRPNGPRADAAVLESLRIATQRLTTEEAADLTRVWREQDLPKLEDLSPIQAETALALLEAVRETTSDLSVEELPL